MCKETDYQGINLKGEGKGKQAKGSFPFGDVRHEQEKCTIVLSSYTASQILDPAVLWADTLLSIKEMLFNSDLGKVGIYTIILCHKIVGLNVDM